MTTFFYPPENERVNVKVNSWVEKFLQFYSNGNIDVWRNITEHEDAIDGFTLDSPKNCPWADLKEVLKNWDKVMKMTEEIATELGYQLFDIDPQCKDIFPTLKDVDEKDAAEDEKFLMHSRAVLRGINTAFRNLSSNYEESEILPIIGESHIKRAVNCNMMQEIKTAVIKSCFKILDLPVQHKKSWESVMNFIFLKYLCVAYPEEEKKVVFDME